MQTITIPHEQAVTDPCVITCLQNNSFRLMEIEWYIFLHWWIDTETGDVIIEYE